MDLWLRGKKLIRGFQKLVSFWVCSNLTKMKPKFIWPRAPPLPRPRWKIMIDYEPIIFAKSLEKLKASDEALVVTLDGKIGFKQKTRKGQSFAQKVELRKIFSSSSLSLSFSLSPTLSLSNSLPLQLSQFSSLSPTLSLQLSLSPTLSLSLFNLLPHLLN